LKAIAIGVILLLAYTSAVAYSQSSGYVITVQTDKPYYYAGDTVYISGRFTYNDWGQQNVFINIYVARANYNGYSRTDSDGNYSSSFTLGTNAAVGTYTVSVTAPTCINQTTFQVVPVVLEVPYQNQGDTDWSGPTSLAMVLRYYGIDFHSWNYTDPHTGESAPKRTPIMTIECLNDYVSSHYSWLTPVLGCYSSTDQMSQHIIDDIESNITAGYPVILRLAQSGKGHYVVITGFNDSGTYINEPSGAVFGPDYLNLTLSPPNYHAFLTWQNWDALKKFIPLWPDSATLSVQGSPPQPLGATTYFTNLYGERIDFEDPSTPDKYRYVDLDYGLTWKLHYALVGNDQVNNIITPEYSTFMAWIWVSKTGSSESSFTLSTTIVGEDGSQNPLPDSIVSVQGYQEELCQVSMTNLILEKTQYYHILFRLWDSDGYLVDSFVTPDFYYLNLGMEFSLAEQQHHLYLHVYDAQGNHVGLNYTTNETDLEIPGAYYYDDSNGTTLIVLPQITNLTIVVDARYAEEPIEPYNLTVTSETEICSSIQTCNGSIVQGTTDTHHLYVPPGDTPIIDDTPPCTKLIIGDPNYALPAGTYVTNETSFTLLADDGTGSGVAETEYRITNSTSDTGWIPCTTSFKLTSLSEGSYNLSYNSTDNAGNIEISNEATIIVVPTLAHDVGVDNIESFKTVVGAGCNDNITVTSTNCGFFAEIFNVTIYMNTTAIGTQSITLASGSSTAETFTWNTTGFAYGNYIISAYAWPVPNETNTANNNLTGGVDTVTIPGDVNGDGTVNILDAILLASAFGSTPGSSNWNPSADVNGDGVVNIFDAIIQSNHFLQHFP
jgi:hypothetical protein